MPRGTAMEAPDSSGASSFSPDDVRSLISDMAREMADLREQVAAQANRMPTFQPNQVRADYASIYAGLERGKPFEPVTGDRRQITDVRGQRISDTELSRNPPRFQNGEYIRLNLDVTPRGADRTWGEIVTAANAKRPKNRPCSTVGRVQFIQYRRDDGTYKYKCVFPGFTALSADKDRGDGFEESDLLPLDG